MNEKIFYKVNIARFNNKQKLIYFAGIFIFVKSLLLVCLVENLFF